MRSQKRGEGVKKKVNRRRSIMTKFVTRGKEEGK